MYLAYANGEGSDETAHKRLSRRCVPMRLVFKSLVDILADITMIKLSNSGGSDQSVHR